MSAAIDRLDAALEGRYRVESELGEGGMATVYLAEDLKHERRVAIKVLKPELAAVIGAERFVAEIKTTAQLQHPHILPLFDSGEADGFLFYVMPYIEGENLRDRIEREGQLGVEEAVRIAREVADALDYAHRNGIIHRDIKPANVLLHDGRPMVADFGIALAVSAAGGGRMTETGLSLGTPHYMSPEQASADRDLTARSDVYSLGCVLYEMLAGQPPHTGPSAQSILVRILTEDPRDVSELRRTVPPHVAATVMKAIEKLPADRFGDAKEFKDALEDPGFRYTRAAPRAAASPAGRAAPRGSAGPWLSDTRSRVTVGLVALLALALVLQILGPDSPAAPDRTVDPPVRALLDLGNLSTANPQFYPVAVSPDGSRFAVLRSSDDGMGQVYHRTAEDMEFRAVPGAEGLLSNLAFSPDGEWIAYTEASGLMRVSLLGGQPTRLFAADSIRPRILDWGAEGWIVFWEFDTGRPGIYRIPDTGGPVERLVSAPDWTPDPQPSLLPDGSGILFSDVQRGIGVYEFEANSARVLLPTGVHPTYVHSGHLVYIDAGGGLWAAPFNLDGNDVAGDPKPVLQGVMTTGSFGSFSVSRNGTLVYTSGPPTTGSSEDRIVVTEVDGTVSVLELPPRRAWGLRWAPDGRRIAYAGREPGDTQGEEEDIYLYDTELQNAPTRLTNRGDNTRPVFSPDGSRVVFSSIREGTEGWDLFIRNLQDDAPPALLISLPGLQFATDWPADSLIVMESGSAIQTVTLNGDTATYYAPDADVDQLRVAPNGGLAAYHSDESGEDEVYIRAFPDPRIETIVSEHPGFARWPWWSDDGRTLYYWAADTIWAAEIEVEPTPRVASRRPLFADSGRFFLNDFRGGRFLGTRAADAGGASGEEDEPIRYVVIHDWFTELERIFEGGR